MSASIEWKGKDEAPSKLEAGSLRQESSVVDGKIISTLSITETKLKPPDGGYGWFVVLGAFLTHVFLVGLARVMGLLYLLWKERYLGSNTATSWITAIFNTTRTLTAPLCGILCDRLGCQLVTFIGASLMCIGLGTSAFVQNIVLVYLTFGLVGGFGGAMTFVSAYVMVGKYFDKKKGKAMAIATLGSGLGNMSLAWLLPLLMDIYAYTGTMLILAGIELHHMVSASLYRPLPRIREKEITHVSLTTTHSVNNKKIEDSAENTQQKSISTRVREMVSNDSLLTNITFILYALVVMGMQVAFVNFIVYIPTFVKEHGGKDTQISIILAIFSVCDIIGRVIFGFIFDLKVFRSHRRYLFCFVSVAMGIMCFILAFMTSYVGDCIMTVFLSFFEGAVHSQRMTVQSEIVQPFQASTAVGFIIFAQGVGNLLSLPLGGHIMDQYGSAKYVLIVMSSFLVVAAVIFTCQQIFLHCKNKSQGENS